MLIELLSRASAQFSPIGQIPNNYFRMTRLCRTAHIAYRDEKLKDKDGNEFVYRTWHVVPDKQPARDRRGNVKGSASTEFKKFCMLLDLIEHEHPDWSRTQVLDEALDLTTPNAKKLMRMTWQNMQDAMANMLVSGYQILRSKQTSKEPVEAFEF